MTTTTNIKNTTGGWLLVGIESPEKVVGGLQSTSNTAEAPREFKKATILHTFDQSEYPVGSVWMMSDVPGMKINFFGEKFIAIQERDLYAKLG